MSHYDDTKNRFNPCNRFIGDIENGLRYPFACYTKEESDERYARKTTETDLAELEALVNTKASQADLNAFEAQMNNSIAAIQKALDNKADKSTVEAIQSQIVDILQRLDAIEYKSIVIQSFTASPSIIELGSNSTVSLVWSLNKTALTQTINGEAVTGSSKLYTNVSASTTYNLIVADNASQASNSVSVEAANQIYYGVDTDLSSVTSLTKVLSNNKGRTFTVNAGTGQYIIYAYPARLGTNVEFWVENFEGGFENPVELNLTNASGYIEKYYVFRSTNPNLGNTTVDVKEV